MDENKETQGAAETIEQAAETVIERAENALGLKAGTKLFIGSLCLTLAHAAEFVAEHLSSRDQLAESLAAGSNAAYVEHRDQFAHEIVRDHVFAEGEKARPARFKVSYGLAGARVEALLGPVEIAAVIAPSEGGEKADEPTDAVN